MSYVGTTYTVEQVKAIPNLYERTQDLLVSGSDSPQRRMMVMGQANSLVKSAMADPIQYVSNNFARDIFNDYIGATSNSLKNSVDFLRKSGFTQDQINQKYQEAIPTVQSQLATVEAARQKRESGFGDLMPIIAMGVSLFAPGIGTAIGSALGLTGTAAAVVGSAIVQGTLAEAQGGDFLDGAIKGAVTAGVAPAVANTVGTAVADVMADSAFKNVVANAVASSASSAVTAALTGGDVDQAALTGALAGGVGSVGRDIGTAVGLETDPFSQQTQMLAAQEQGLGTAGGAGAQLGQALGAIGAGADPIQALLSGASGFMQEVSRATPTAGESGLVGPVASAPVQVGDVFVPGAENVAQLITSGGEQLAGPGGLTARAVEAMPEMQPRANEIAGPVEEKVEDGYVFFQREIQVTLPDGKTASYLISYDPNDTKTPIRYETATGGGESGFLIRSSATRPTFDTTTEATTGGNVATIGAPSTFVPEQVNILDLISAGRGDVSQGQPITVAPTAPVEAIPGVSEPVSGGQIDVSGAPVGAVPDIGAEITPPSTQEIPIPDQISQELGGGGVGVGGEAETVPGAVDVNVPGAGGTDFGLGGGAEAPGTGEVAVSGEVTPGAGEEVAGPGVAEDVAIDAGGEVVTEDVFPQEPTVTESPVDEPVAETLPEEVVAEEAVAQPTPVVTPYIRDFFISGGRRRGDTFGPTVTTLGQALAPPLFPSSPVSGLTSYRGAGEIEGQQTGKPRRNVWNEASLRLKDALGL